MSHPKDSSKTPDRTPEQESLMPIITSFENAAFDCGISKGTEEWDRYYAVLTEERNKLLDYIAASESTRSLLVEALKELLAAESDFVASIQDIRTWRLHEALIKARSALSAAHKGGDK